jgi:hypothetical protein
MNLGSEKLKSDLSQETLYASIIEGNAAWIPGQ